MRGRILIGIVLGVTLYLLLTLGIYQTFSSRVTGANDFFPRWRGAQAFLLQGQDPYSDIVTREIQLDMYGRLARPDEDQVAFAYPLYVAFLIAPLAVLPYAWAQAVWMALLALAVVGGTLTLSVAREFKFNPFTLALLIIGALVYYPSVRGIFLGQFALVSFACLAFASFAIAVRQDYLAGVMLILATVKPQDIVFLIPLVLLWAARAGRWKIWIGAGMTGFVLVGGAMLFIPDWLVEFAHALNAYAGYIKVGAPLHTALAFILPASGVDLSFSLGALVLIGAMFVFWWRDSKKSWNDLRATFDFTALVTTLCAVRIGTPDQVLLIFPWLSWLQLWSERKQSLRVVGAMFALVVIPWATFMATLKGDSENLVVTIVLPLVTLAVFLASKLER